MSHEIAHVGHVELLTARPVESLRFFTAILGLSVVAKQGDSTYMRGYGDYERVGFKLTAAREPGLGHVGFRARSPADLKRCVNALMASGCGEGWIEGDIGHGPSFRFRTPDGHLCEVYHQTERQDPPVGLAKNRFAPRGQGGVGVSRVDHFNLFARDVAANRRFAETELGARCLDVIVDDDGRETGAFTTFSVKPLDLVFSADSFARGGRLHHLAFWVDTREEVLRAADVFLDHGVPIEVAPALHTVGSSFFLYGFEPGGNRIEVTSGAVLDLDPDGPTRIWTAEERRAGIGWGTSFPDSWRTYGTPPAEPMAPGPVCGPPGIS
jgi:catechol 2,3-dioxygenase